MTPTTTTFPITYTEEEAKNKKCVLLVQASLSNPTMVDASGRMNRNAWDGCKCLGSACMTGWAFADGGDHGCGKGYCRFINS